MVEWAVVNYGEPFLWERGMTQGDPISTTIFNVVVDAVVRHWESMVEEGHVGKWQGQQKQ